MDDKCRGAPRVVQLNDLPGKRPDGTDPQHSGRMGPGAAPNRVSNTKYTVLTFLPRNVREQFGRLMNMYFLLVAVLQMWGRIAPVNPTTTWGPLLVIFAFTASKEAYDDIGRHRRDAEVNSRPVQVFTSGVARTMRSEQIAVGDTVVVREGQKIPCDLVLLATSSACGTCYVETAALDGETDLKVRTIPGCCRGLGLEGAGAVEGLLECGPPDQDCHGFRGRLCLDCQEDHRGQIDWEPLGLSQTLFQSCHLRNTEWVAGVAVYTGPQTKMEMCKGKMPTKVARVDRRIDLFTACVFCGQLTVVAVMGTAGNLWQGIYGVRPGHTLCCAAQQMPYLMMYKTHSSDWYEWLVIPLRFLLLCSIAVPISLKITMDVVKAFYALLIQWDRQMMHPETGEGATASNTSISEDLGQVCTILTDKTGTLTENKMCFKYICLDGHHFGGHGAVPITSLPQPSQPPDLLGSEADDSRGSMIKLGPGALEDDALRSMVSDALRERRGLHETSRASLALHVLAMCNSAIPRAEERQPGEGENSYVHPSYMTPSPDEDVLVTTAAELGLVLRQRHGGNTAVLEVCPSGPQLGSRVEFEVLHILEFTSERRCMSVSLIAVPVALAKVRGEGNAIVLLTKGADDVVLSALKPSEEGRKVAATEALEAYAAQGLRTLCLAAREVTSGEYERWAEGFRWASGLLQGREEAVAQSHREMEHSLDLLGVTAIEDRLQARVPETVRKLKDAGIAIWMITGDKLSTAVQMGHACGLASPEPKGRILVLAASSPEQATTELQRLWSQLSDPLMVEEAVLVVDGAALEATLRAGQQQLLFRVASRASAALFCRVTPGQKASVVKLVKASRPGSIVLAIGDGGNDVEMIQAADVGVGIKGREGQQAAMAADYSVGEFRCLSRLILVHGRYSVIRTSFIAIYCIYKSIMLCFMQLLFAVASGASGTSFYNSFALMAYNVLFTLSPSLAYAMNRDADQEVLMAQPHLLRPVQAGNNYSFQVFGGWALLAVYHATVIYATMMCALGVPHAGGQVGGDMEVIAMAAYSATIWVNALVVSMESHIITLPQAIATWGIVPLFYLTSGAVSALPSLGMPGVMSRMVSSPAYWLALPLVAVLTTGPLMAMYISRAGARAQLQDLLHRKQALLKRWSAESGLL